MVLILETKASVIGELTNKYSTNWFPKLLVHLNYTESTVQQNLLLLSKLTEIIVIITKHWLSIILDLHVVVVIPEHVSHLGIVSLWVEVFLQFIILTNVRERNCQVEKRKSEEEERGNKNFFCTAIKDKLSLFSFFLLTPKSISSFPEACLIFRILSWISWYLRDFRRAISCLFCSFSSFFRFS